MCGDMRRRREWAGFGEVIGRLSGCLGVCTSGNLIWDMKISFAAFLFLDRRDVSGLEQNVGIGLDWTE
jgi:hypothetical protein